MDSRAILIPGGLRLRTVHPIDQGGSCHVVYDLERNLLVEVPDVYRYHIAMALESGNPDENLLGWLASEDLLTYERGGTTREGGIPVADLSELSHPFGCVFFIDDHAHCQLGDGTDQAALETLDCLLHRLDNLAHLTVHLNAENGRLGVERLRQIVESTDRRVQKAGRTVAFDLGLDPATTTPALVDLLERHEFRVRVRSEGPGAATPELNQSLRLLAECLGDRLVVHTFLRGERLQAIWDWARDLGLRHVHVTKLAGGFEGPVLRERELREFREDLSHITDQMMEGLQTEGAGTLYEPLVRVVRRLVRQQRAATRAGASLGWVSNGQMLPVFQAAAPSFEAGPALSAWDLEDEGDPSDFDGVSAASPQPCQRCWAQRLCGRGVAADPALTAEERLQPGGGSCDFWQAEVEAGLMFYRRLRDLDPDHLLGLGEDDRDGFVDSLDDTSGFIEWRTC